MSRRGHRFPAWAVRLSLHEIVGEVIATRSDLSIGQRVVGWVGQSLGLAEFVVTGAEALAPGGREMDDIDAVPRSPAFSMA